MTFFQSIDEILKQVKEDPSSVYYIVEKVISSLDSLGKKLQAVRFTDLEFAKDQIDKNKNRNNYLPFYGVPLAHKELFGRVKPNGEGWPDEAGSKSRKGIKSNKTSKVIEKLDSAGVIDCGRLVSVEFAFGVTGHNEYAGTPRNPWNNDYICGGSSSGSAAVVAAGIVPGALGTDTGGSVRLPASACGLVGIKPTQGLVGKSGVFPLSNSLDSVGPLTRSVTDAAKILQLISGYDQEDPLSKLINIPNYLDKLNNGLSGIKIGLPENYFLTGSDAEISDYTNETFLLSEKLGANCISINVPDIEPVNDLNFLLIASEAAKLHHSIVLDNHCNLNDQTLMRILAGFFTRDSEYQKLVDYRAYFTRYLINEVFSRIDILMTPVWPMPLPNIEESDIGANLNATALVKRIGHNTRPVNYLGLPAICLPTGFDKNGLPVSVQLIGKPFSEDTLISAAYALEREYKFWDNRPKLI